MKNQVSVPELIVKNGRPRILGWKLDFGGVVVVPGFWEGMFLEVDYVRGCSLFGEEKRREERLE